ncbi:triphosphoribosyl-dephospho-CoA synthase [Pseudomonas batumici]|uniref:Probable 2-(5''-triphosphoribosyl)-3'-dephosphocoenzyme-A synthase n=1 Tax=Pseudomonas batumici TaxID=226910 RepID=A0A0C2HVV5_9PSED|nr:triphosphoribosyl-dephospho-CoA synthase [Pseudomonas batumici]KIH81296.1 Triphosphoribosyl-dephospho-CoA synthetase [Pseudomonas batumici]KIH82518.1 Triphosphoribosyl-dephospho-CoA synthetase [Pseudomonas batumici]
MHAFNLQAQPLSLAERLADFAVEALIDEADLSPKPALVDRRGNGAHTDLHLGLMHASALSLWPMFKEMAEAAQGMDNVGDMTENTGHCRSELARDGGPGAAGYQVPRVIVDAHREQARSYRELREALGRIGREGEQVMLQTTCGVNTHRGAIWALGLLVAAAALDPRSVTANALTLRAARLALLEDRYAPNSTSHGSQVAQRYGARGAREEAQLGFPAVTRLGLPQLQRSRLAGHGEQNARLDALLAIMTTLADTCVLYRAGVPGLQAMQQGARAVLEAGGSASLAGRRCLHELDQQLLAMNASPGGAADLLAACLLIDRLEQEAL